VEFLTAEQIAKITKLSVWFVYQNRQLFGGIKLGKAVRFDKETFETKMKEVIESECLPASGQVAIRVHDRRSEVSGQRLRNKTGGQRRRSRTAQELKADEFGLFAALQESPARPQD
jgi:hypothetical protein